MTHDELETWFQRFAPRAKRCTDKTVYGLILDVDFGLGVKWCGIVDHHTRTHLMTLLTVYATRALGG